ncbi:MAG: energy transducer TonB [Cyclobacteriaceae bacterium]|nr:energy transducer TonB [Cyclobacteriaceae bacterium]
MKIVGIITLFLSSIINSFGQSKTDDFVVGYYHDIHGQSINGFYSTDYSARKSFYFTYPFKDNTKGAYYDATGLRFEGYIRGNLAVGFSYTPSIEKKYKPIDIDNCIGLKMGVDSFAVIKNFEIQRANRIIKNSKNEFVEVIGRVGENTFYKHVLAGQTTFITHLVKHDSSNEFKTFLKDGDSFKNELVKYFGEYEVLKNKILDGKYKFEDLDKLINWLRFAELTKNRSVVYYNSSWEEVPRQQSKYYSISESVIDSLIHMSFYSSDRRKLFEGGFVSFYPNKRVGEFIYYDINGKIVSKTVFEENKAKRVMEYFPNGQLRREYIIENNEPIFKEINDSNGKNLISSSGTAQEVLFDTIRNREITYEYFQNRISKVYFNSDDGKRIYQLAPKNIKLKSYEFLQTKFIENNRDLYDSVKTFTEKIEGYVFVKCIVDPAGNITSASIVKTLNSSFDLASRRFIPYLKAYKGLDTGKVDEKDIYQEVIVPFNFSVLSDNPNFKNWGNNMNYMNFMNNTLQQMRYSVPPPIKF